MLNASIPSLVLDLMVILIIVGFVWAGIRRGFLVTLVNSCGRLISCVGAYIGSRALATTIYQVYIRDKLVSTVSSSITVSLSEYDPTMQVSTAMQAVPGILRNMVYGVFGETSDIVTMIGDTLNGTIQTVSVNLVDQVIYPVVYMILQSILFLLLYTCLKIVIGALSETLRNIRKNVLVGVPDMLCGAIFGLAQAVLSIFVIVVIVKLLIYCSGARIPYLTDESIGSTRLFKIFYELSPFSGKWTS
jgi:hypothetical protein